MDGLLHLACLGTLVTVELHSEIMLMIYNLIPISQFPIPIPMFANTITTFLIPITTFPRTNVPVPYVYSSVGII